MRRTFRILVVVGALLGLAASLELTWVHYKVHTEPTHRSLCAIDARMDCDAVAASPQATLLGVPVALWGLLSYVVVLWLGLRSRRERSRFPAAPLAWVFWASLGMAGYSAYLAYVSFTALATFCLFCAFLWGVNGLLLFGALAAARSIAPVAGLRADLALARRSPLRVAVLSAVPVAVGLSLVFGFRFLYPEMTRPGAGTTVILAADHLPPDLPFDGPPDAPHTLVAVGDYRCPFCRNAFGYVEAFRAEYPDLLRVAHIHFPLEDVCNPSLDWKMHPGACDAARAAECARAQHKLWEMHAALFTWQGDVWEDDVPLTLARAMGLDPIAFQRCMDHDEGARQRIAEHIALCERLNILGTPTIYLDGRMLAEPIREDTLAGLLGTEGGEPRGGPKDRP